MVELRRDSSIAFANSFVISSLRSIIVLSVIRVHRPLLELIQSEKFCEIVAIYCRLL